MCLRAVDPCERVRRGHCYHSGNGAVETTDT